MERSLSEKGCRLTFVVTNNLGGELSKAAFEVAMFNETGTVDRLTVLDFKDLPSGKTKVARFDLGGADCGKISRLLINTATECAGTGIEPPACLRDLRTTTNDPDRIRRLTEHGALAADPALAIDRMSWAQAGADAWMVEPDDARLPILPGGLLETTAGRSARRGIVADNDDTLPLPAGEPLAVPGSPIARRRSWTIGPLPRLAPSMPASRCFSWRADPTLALLEGSENAGITILGDAPDDQAMSGDMSQVDPAAVTEVTLISAIEAKPVETTDAVAVTQVEKAEIVEPLLPETTAVETLEPVERGSRVA